MGKIKNNDYLSQAKAEIGLKLCDINDYTSGENLLIIQSQENLTSAIQRDVLIKLNMYNAFTRDATKLINKTICHKLEGKQSFQSHQIREAFKETAIIVTFFLSH